MNNMYNICDEIRCPYSSRNGCDRYSVSNHCHLLFPKKGQQRPGLHPNQYWLFAEENDNAIDINQLKDENEQFLKTDESTLRRVELGLSPFDACEVRNAN